MYWSKEASQRKVLLRTCYANSPTLRLGGQQLLAVYIMPTGVHRSFVAFITIATVGRMPASLFVLLLEKQRLIGMLRSISRLAIRMRAFVLTRPNPHCNIFALRYT